jgi:MFS transporter, FHS family, L-fucose permease
MSNAKGREHEQSNTRRKLMILYILSVWFALSFVTNLIGPLLPTIIDDFHINYTLAGLLPFSFFLAYGIISIPASFLLEFRGPKATLQTACAINVAGAALIGFNTTYAATIAGLFLIGLGMASLQVVLNPLTRAVVGEQDFAFYSVLGQLVFGAASFLSPFTIRPIYAWSQAVGVGFPQWAAFYLIFAGAFLAYLVMTSCISVPHIAPKEEERAGTLAVYTQLLRSALTWKYFLAIIAYVGTEQSIADWLSQFLQDYHGAAAASVGAQTVALFWGAMSIGCLCGMILLRIVAAQRLLTAATVMLACTLLLALIGEKRTALIAFPLCGFMLSVMFSIIFSLALNSMKNHHGAFSGILCSGILGGAFLPFVVGWLADRAGLRTAMFLVFVPIAYMAYISLWARPLVSNRTVRIREILLSCR